jgi:hypothetical protein
MKTYYALFKIFVVTIFFLSLSITAMAQSIVGVEAIALDPPQNQSWQINVTFTRAVPEGRIKQSFLINVNDQSIISLRNFAPLPGEPRIYSGSPGTPLEAVKDPKTGFLKFTKHYELRLAVENDKGEILSLGTELTVLNENQTISKQVHAEANDSDDADVYISGEVNGAHKQQASFTTEIKLQRYKPVSASWRYTPYFKLNASTDPGADPDTMESGLNFRYILGKFANIPGAYYDNAIKLESERDFDNTNLIYDTRFTFLPAAKPRGATKYKVFFNPFIGAELGKNLRSPLKAAEGDGIARALAGADLRLVVFVKNEDAPDINWTTSYVRRWLFTDELGFETDDNGDLQLSRFGKSPRDHVLSKFSYRINKFFDVFTAYEWGEVPPSYKLVDHRFRLGFAYKFKFAVK